jgi:hypothetical protein
MPSVVFATSAPSPWTTSATSVVRLTVIPLGEGEEEAEEAGEAGAAAEEEEEEEEEVEEAPDDNEPEEED